MMKALALACVLVATPALAQESKAQAVAAYKLGQALYEREDYVAAAKQFEAAYALDPDPVYLFNIGQAYRLAKQCKEAGDFYRRYLDAAKRAPNADAVKAYIAEVDDCAQAEAPVVVAPPEPPSQVVVRQEPPSERSNKRLVGYIVGAGGVAFAGLGVLFLTQVNGLEDDANSVCPRPCTMWDDAKAAERERIDGKAATREKLMVGSWIAGGAAIAAGVYLVVTGGQAREGAVAITPTKHGAVATFRF